MSFVAASNSAAFTVDGTSNGVATIASTTGFYVGATVWISGTGKPSVQAVIAAITSNTTFSVRATGGISYGYLNLATYTVAANSRIDQDSQVVPGDSITGPESLIGALTITNVSSGASAIIIPNGTKIQFGDGTTQSTASTSADLSAYETTAHAAATYQTIALAELASHASSTYQTIALAETSAHAAATYQTIALAETSSHAAATYQTIALAETATHAAATYQTIALAETSSHASSTYLPLAGGTLTGGLVGTTIAGSSFNGLTATTATVKGFMVDGASAVGTVIDTNVAYANAASKLLSIRNNGTEKSYFSPIGGLIAGTGPCEFKGDVASYAALLNGGILIGAASGFPGMWVLGTGGAANTSNYMLLSAGDTIVNSPSGSSTTLRVNNANILRATGSTVDFFFKATFPATDSSGTPGAATINKVSGQVAIAAGASTVTVTNSLVTTTSIVYAVLQQNDTTLTTILSVVPAAGSFVIKGNVNATANTKVGFIVFNA